MAHNYNIIDADPKLQIVKATRQITVPPTCQVIGTVGDHNSEQLTFQCPRYMDAHDLSGCAVKWISYTNASGKSGKVQITDVVSDDDYIYFTWLISSLVTEASGSISFSIHFEDHSELGEVLYRWGTTTNDDLRVLTAVGSAEEYDDPLQYVNVDEATLLRAVTNEVERILNEDE